MARPLILLVDDEPHITRVVASRLQRAGFDTIEAHDGQAGFETACDKQPSMIFADLQMPHLNGIEMATKLAATESTSAIPVVMLTARGYLANNTQLAQTNIKHLLAKPFSARQLVECAIEILGEPTMEKDAA